MQEMNQDSAGSQRALVHEISDKRPLFHVGSPNPPSAAGKKKRKWARTEPHPHARRRRAHHPVSRPRATIPATRVRTSPTVHPIYFCIANTGKETIALDFRDPDAKTFLMKLIAKADVAVENFRPGVMTTTGVLESEGGRQSRVGISVSQHHGQHPRLRRQRPPAGQARLPVLGPPGTGHLQTAYVSRTGAKPKPA